ncbi:unnamed protein product [Cylindrotheca closterium]|uniref:Phytocyanin domain-containing protein n=1 Tax=Cylindrotheca closterium TaxID=2856 RepID=A0AAD2CQZ9_9STRA|nr:unnamed protein product [Cylindrotheca closterium]
MSRTRQSSSSSASCLLPSYSTVLLLILLIQTCHIPSVSAKDLLIEFWSPTLDHEPLPEQFVTAGDTVTFKVYGPHTVFIHPSLSCDPSNRNELVPKQNSNSVTYTFQENDSDFFGNEMLFVCDAGSHCEQGQQARFRVFPTPQPPSPAPSSFLTRPTTSVNKPEDDLAAALPGVPIESNTADGTAGARTTNNEDAATTAEEQSSAFGIIIATRKSLFVAVLVTTMVSLIL